MKKLREFWKSIKIKSNQLFIKGGKLKIAGDHPEVGVFFEDEAANSTQVEMNDIIMNKSAELMVQIPALPAGKYRLVIRTQFSGSSTTLKDVRVNVYEKVLTVE